MKSTKKVIVTGTSRGIGYELVKLFSKAGHKVLALSRNNKPTSELNDPNVTSLSFDLNNLSDFSEVNDFIKKEWNNNVDILINNAGIAVSKSSLKTSIEDWDNVINTNLRGVFACSKVFANNLVKQKKPGKIVNISSIAAEIVLGNYLSSYCASKAAVSHLTRTLAFEYAKYNIQVNAIAPGYILTDLNRNFFETDEGKEMIETIPQKRLGKPEELDGALLLLCTELGSFMTGSVIRVDGGHVIG